MEFFVPREEGTLFSLIQDDDDSSEQQLCNNSLKNKKWNTFQALNNFDVKFNVNNYCDDS